MFSLRNNCLLAGEFHLKVLVLKYSIINSKYPIECLFNVVLLQFQSPCCELQLDRVKAGGCTVHARRCGGDNGIFLRLRKCQIILLSDVKRGKLSDS